MLALAHSIASSAGTLAFPLPALTAFDWVALAAGFGVPGVAVDTVDTFDKALVRGLSVDGPFLVAALLS